jgi:hypothetical protein
LERRLELRHHDLNAPTHGDVRDVVQPNRAMPPRTEVDALDAPVGSERSVAPPVPAMHADVALDRLSPERIAEIRTRLETGAYGSLEVMTELAIRMLDSGDLA